MWVGMGWPALSPAASHFYFLSFRYSQKHILKKNNRSAVAQPQGLAQFVAQFYEPR